jgi:hypothetical protein
MSVEAVTRIIGRALVDPEYRTLLFDDPPAALAEYTLTAEETTALKNIAREQFALVEAELRERIALTIVSTEREPSALAQAVVAKKLNDLFDWAT